MAMTAASGVSTAAEKSTTAHVVWAAALGTAIEWYDFLIYGTAAALVLNKLFFPSFDPMVGTLAAFSTYAVGFVARPIGGAIIGITATGSAARRCWSRPCSRWDWARS